MRRLVRPLLAGLLLLGLAPATALARQQQDMLYPAERVWNAAVRLLRLELGCTISERDVEAGYILFEYHDGARAFPGSIELVRMPIDDVPDAARVFVSIPSLPRYIEIMIADRLSRKLLEELGEPLRRPRPAPAASGRGSTDGSSSSRGPSDRTSSRGSSSRSGSSDRRSGSSGPSRSGSSSQRSPSPRVFP